MEVEGNEMTPEQLESVTKLAEIVAGIKRKFEQINKAHGTVVNERVGDIIQVQPIVSPKGAIFYLDLIYGAVKVETARYEVVVGNIGTVLRTNDLEEAHACVGTYVDKSTHGEGRCAHESVTLFDNGELLYEFENPEEEEV